MKIVIMASLLTFNLLADVSVADAWAKMQEKNAGLIASKSDVTRATLKRSSAKSMYLPSISLNASYTHLNEAIGIDSSGISDFMAALPLPLPFPSRIDFSEQDIFLADLQLLWPLYVGGKIDAAQDIYSSKVTESEALHQMKKDKAFLKLIKIYYGVVMSHSLYNTRVDVQKALQQHFEDAQKLKAQGQIARVELLNAEVKLDEAKIETTKAKHKLDIVSSSLKNMIKSREKPSSKLFVNEVAKSEEYYQKETQENSAALVILDAKASQSASLVQIKEAAWHPKVVAFGNYNLYRDDSPLMSMSPDWFAGLVLKIDILKRKDRAQEIQAAKLINTKVKNLKIQAQEDLLLLVEKTYNEMLLYRDEYNSLNSSLELSQENYKLRSIAFGEGLATSSDVIDAQMFLAGAKTKRLNAAYNYVMKISQLSVLSANAERFFEILNVSEEIE